MSETPEEPDKYTVSFLIDPDNQTPGCWVTRKDRPTEILAASWADEEPPPQKEYKGWDVQHYGHKHFLDAMDFFQKVTDKFRWTILNEQQYKKMQEMWFPSSKDSVSSCP